MIGIQNGGKVSAMRTIVVAGIIMLLLNVTGVGPARAASVHSLSPEKQSPGTEPKAEAGDQTPSPKPALKTIPKTIVDHTNFDFGVVDPDQMVSHSFTIRNDGLGELVIARVVPG